MRLAALLVVAAVVVAGCAGASPPTATETTDSPTAGSPTDAPTTDDPTAEATTDASTTDGDASTTTTRITHEQRPDPEEDRLGWEDGYWYDDPIAVDESDGFNETELDRLLARTMARVERIRDLEFERSVDFEVISREEYRDRNVFSFPDDPWRDQVWEATFIVNESADSGAAFEAIYSGSVAGYYQGGQIVLISDDPSGVQVDRATLAHELTHALHAQHFGFRGGGTYDARQAALSVTEGDANHVMDRYEKRCGTEWRCIDEPPGLGGSPPANRGLFLTLFVPYSDGPTLVAELRERGGWAAVNDAMENRPASTEQVIHPGKYPDERPVDVVVPDRSNAEWSRFGNSRETVGEATLLASFWYNGVIDEDHLQTDENRYNYSHPATAGWGGDAVVPYRSGTDDPTEYGYVFKTVWDTERDARQFHEAYLDLLESKGARQVRRGVYRIPEGEPYADAFRVVRSGDEVVVVNAPTVDDLAGVHEPR